MKLYTKNFGIAGERTANMQEPDVEQGSLFTGTLLYYAVEELVTVTVATHI